MNWDKMCEVKEMGGLGFRKLDNFNIAMLAKQARRLINNTNSLTTNIMKARYYAHTDFLDATLGASPSFMWRSIMASQELVNQGCRRKIGDGKNTRVWQIPWLPCVKNGFFTSKFHNKLKDIVVHNLMEEGHKGWDEDLLKDLCNDRDRELIQQIPIPGRNRLARGTGYWRIMETSLLKVVTEEFKGKVHGGRWFQEAALGT